MRKAVDPITIAAISVVVYGAATMIHEALGHGGACIAVGCVPKLLSSMQFEGDADALTRDAHRIIAAGGSLANIVAAIPALMFLNARRGRTGTAELAAWMFASVNLMMATGYLLFSGLGGVGDWVVVVDGLGPKFVMRAGLAVCGAIGYRTTTQWSMVTASALVGGPVTERWRRVYALTINAYITGGVLSVVSGVLNPAGMQLVLISAVAASFGGTSGFAWGPQQLKDPKLNPDLGGDLEIPRSAGWIVAAIAVIVPFVFVLGPGVPL